MKDERVTRSFRLVARAMSASINVVVLVHGKVCSSWAPARTLSSVVNIQQARWEAVSTSVSKSNGIFTYTWRPILYASPGSTVKCKALA